MADPLTTIGSTALVTGIIDLLAKSISKLHEFHSRWKQADFTFINLIAQLSALKATLTKIEEWMDTNAEEERDLHHQLIMDLEAVITCCKLLAYKIDSEISGLYIDSDNTLRSESKAKLVLKNDALEELQKMVDRQTNALTTLLTACNFKIISNQKNLLERTTARKIIQHAKDDTSSLYVQLGSTSICSGRSWYTDTLSKISRCFEFDRELFSSKVYEKVLRNSLKDTVDALRRQASPGLRTGHTKKIADSQEDVPETRRLQSIDRKLEKEWKRRQKPGATRIVLLGDYDCAQAFVNETKILHPNQFTTEELQNYKSMIRDNISRIMQAVEFIIEGTSVNVDNTAREVALGLCHKLRSPRSDDATLSRTAAEALQEGWATKKLCKIIMQSGQPEILISVEYFIQEIDRIMDEDYIPTTVDILNIKDNRTGIREYQFHVGRRINMLDLSGQCWSEREQWIHHLYGAVSGLFLVDLSSYNEFSPEDTSGNKLKKSIELYRMMAKSPWRRGYSFILMFFNLPTFEKKLLVSPLSDHFSSYEGANNAKEACDYIIQRFRAATACGDMRLYPYCYQANDSPTVRNRLVAMIDEMNMLDLLCKA